MRRANSLNRGAHLLLRNGLRRIASGGVSAFGPISTLFLVTLLTLLALAAGSAGATPISNLVISEIMYEPSGANNGRQWIELYNGTASAINLSDYQLEWGRNNLANVSGPLSGSIASGATFVIGGPTTNGANDSPTYNQVYNFNPDLGAGNHATLEDAVALFKISTSQIMHLVVYGGDGVTGFLDEQGQPATVVNTTGLGARDTLEYLGSGVWQIQTTSTPGAPNIALVPEPHTAMLLGLGLLGLAASRPRR